MLTTRQSYTQLGLIPPAYLNPTTGEEFYVHNGTGSDGNPGTKQLPFKTFDYAIGKCTAPSTTRAAADTIYLLPGHAENVASASAITCDVAGVTVIGLGNGGSRPKFSFTAAAATFVVSADDITFRNVQWEANFIDVVMGIDVSAIDSLTFEDCWFTDAASNLNFLITIDLATGMSNLTVKNCKFIGIDAQDDTFINGVINDGIWIYDSLFSMPIAQAAAIGQIATSGNATNVEIKRCSFVSNVDGAKNIDLAGTACSGIVAECYFSSADGAGAVTSCINFTGGHVFECYVAGEASTWGIVGGGTVYS
jgi:hypothetical protein